MIKKYLFLVALIWNFSDSYKAAVPEIAESDMRRINALIEGAQGVLARAAERGGEDQLVAGEGKLGDGTLGIGAFWHVFDEGGGNLAFKVLFHLLTGLVVLVGPAAVTRHTHIDEAHLQRVLCKGRAAKAQSERRASNCRCGKKLSAFHIVTPR